jgi:hypothetical protein
MKFEINVDHIYPPIPIRSMDWCASLGDGDEAICEYGKTAQEAAARLFGELQELAVNEPEKLRLN